MKWMAIIYFYLTSKLANLMKNEPQNCKFLFHTNCQQLIVLFLYTFFSFILHPMKTSTVAVAKIFQKGRTLKNDKVCQSTPNKVKLSLK